MSEENAETSSNLKGRAPGMLKFSTFSWKVLIFCIIGSVPSNNRLREVKTHLENLGHKKFKFIDWVVFDPDVLLSASDAPIRMFIVSTTDPIEMLDIVDAEKKPMTVDVFTEWAGKTVRLTDPAGGSGGQDGASSAEPDPFRRPMSTISKSALEEINCLVEPLDGRIAEDELLIFSAPGPLRDIPLHALSPRGIGKRGVNCNRMILDSNPVIYATTLEVLEACFSRGRGNNSVHKACFFNMMPDRSPKDKPETESTQYAVERVASMWGESSTSFHRTEVTRDAFCSESQNSTFINFMGHAVPDRRRKDNIGHPSSDSHGDSLLFANNSRWEVTDTLRLDLRRLSPLVMLIACETGQEEFMEGEEPVGMISGFLLVGASTVIGTLWKTPHNSALRFLTLFNEHLNRNAEPDINIVSRAKAFQSAVKELRKTPGKKEFMNPYYWAPFVLHGAP
jgi:CHAT domain-containing protein